MLTGLSRHRYLMPSNRERCSMQAGLFGVMRELEIATLDDTHTGQACLGNALARKRKCFTYMKIIAMGCEWILYDS